MLVSILAYHGGGCLSPGLGTYFCCILTPKHAKFIISNGPRPACFDLLARLGLEPRYHFMLARQVLNPTSYGRLGSSVVAISILSLLPLLLRVFPNPGWTDGGPAGTGVGIS